MTFAFHSHWAQSHKKCTLPVVGGIYVSLEEALPDMTAVTQIFSALVLLSQVNESFVVSQVTTYSFSASFTQQVFIKNKTCTRTL